MKCLRLFESWEYWNKKAGIRQLINQKYFPERFGVFEVPTQSVASQLSDSDARVVTPEPEKVSIPIENESVMIAHEDLYPAESDREVHDQQGYTGTIKGKITSADYYNNVIEVKGSDGTYYSLRIFPDNLSSYGKTQVRTFMKKGNYISCICTVAGARELEIVSATFTRTK